MEQINFKVLTAKENVEDLEKLIAEYKPFIYKTILRTVPHKEMDEYSTIALEAFYEAVKGYDSGKGNFFTYASGVIRRRIIDQLRKEKRHLNHEILDDDMHHELIRFDDDMARKIEIGMLEEELKTYNISFNKLYNKAPKHTETRKKCITAAKIIAQRSELISYLKTKKKLPLKEACELTGLSRKVFERSREYIIALTIINQDKYGYLKEFIKE